MKFWLFGVENLIKRLASTDKGSEIVDCVCGGQSLGSRSVTFHPSTQRDTAWDPNGD